ncbi:iron ABC transporter permease [Corynebacterium vitaeruminis DSM 20294]|uniref:Iron ABC transporter permease n=1 Tax=Corynebacterium vitaeruminis DSM 20294 TaxID=1224164 RepID=W5XYQ8_9CORY|nr:iron ABC transporter permease [Corynebacterium vitaeruminis DSM 20294]
MTSTAETRERGLLVLGSARIRYQPRAVRAVTVLLAACALVWVLSLGIGQFPMSPVEVVRVLAGGGTKLQRTVVIDWRLARSLVGLAVGAALGLSGAITQRIARNGLASPDILGINQGATVAAVACMVFGASGGARCARRRPRRCGRRRACHRRGHLGARPAPGRGHLPARAGRHRRQRLPPRAGHLHARGDRPQHRGRRQGVDGGLSQWTHLRPAVAHARGARRLLAGAGAYRLPPAGSRVGRRPRQLTRRPAEEGQRDGAGGLHRAGGGGRLRGGAGRLRGLRRPAARTPADPGVRSPAGRLGRRRCPLDLRLRPGGAQRLPVGGPRGHRHRRHRRAVPHLAAVAAVENPHPLNTYNERIHTCP